MGPGELLNHLILALSVRLIVFTLMLPAGPWRVYY